MAGIGSGVVTVVGIVVVGGVLGWLAWTNRHHPRVVPLSDPGPNEPDTPRVSYLVSCRLAHWYVVHLRGGGYPGTLTVSPTAIWLRYTGPVKQSDLVLSAADAAEMTLTGRSGASTALRFPRTSRVSHVRFSPATGRALEADLERFGWAIRRA